MRRKLVVETRDFSVWFMISLAEDVPGQWKAHCLDVDVVTYGNDPEQAYHMVIEATHLVIADDLNRGVEPTLRKASDQEWSWLRRWITHAKLRPFTDLFKNSCGTALAVNQTLSFARIAEEVHKRNPAPGLHWQRPSELQEPMATMQA